MDRGWAMTISARWKSDFAPRMRMIMGAWLDKNFCFLPSVQRTQAWEELAGPLIKEVIREGMAVMICQSCFLICSDRCLIFKYQGFSARLTIKREGSKA